MAASARAGRADRRGGPFPLHGWVGILLVAVSWWINWGLNGLRTHWAFFPLWLGYCLAVDAVVAFRTGTSLLTRSVPRYLGLFLVSAPIWWLFELLNLRTQNWIYLGAANFAPLAYAFWTTLSFSTVLPAVLGAAELAASFDLPVRLPSGPQIQPTRLTTILFFAAGWIGLGLLLAAPRVFFPFAWLSIYFIIEPLNVWMGNRSLTDWIQKGDWRPVYSLWVGVLLTAFFWEMWNFLSYPKWIYKIPWGGWLPVFEMPLLGYGGYLPFALELYALYHLTLGLMGQPRVDYVRISEASDV